MLIFEIASKIEKIDMKQYGVISISPFDFEITLQVKLSQYISLHDVMLKTSKGHDNRFVFDQRISRIKRG